MRQKRHEIPTHLNVEDKAFYGLSVRQVMYLSVGFSGAYSLWNALPDLALGVRLGLAATCVFAALVVAFVRPHERGLEEWAFVALHYLAIPKASVWRPRTADLAAQRSSASRWEELSLDVSWKEETP